MTSDTTGMYEFIGEAENLLYECMSNMSPSRREDAQKGLVKPTTMAMLVSGRDSNDGGSGYTTIFAHDIDEEAAKVAMSVIADAEEGDPSDHRDTAIAFEIAMQATYIAATCILHAANKMALSEILKGGPVPSKQDHANLIRWAKDTMQHDLDRMADSTYDRLVAVAKAFEHGLADTSKETPNGDR